MLLLDEIDLQLVHLLQIAPRVTWRDAATIVPRSATALAARWAKLAEDGIVWLSATRDLAGERRPGALVDIDVELAQREAVISRLLADPGVVGLNEGAVVGRLHVTLFADSEGDLATALLDEVPQVPGVLRARARPLVRVHVEGGSWRLDALDATQRRDAAALAGVLREPQHMEVGGAQPTESRGAQHTEGGGAQHAEVGGGRQASAGAERESLRDRVLEQLLADPRASAEEIARAIGAPAATVRRHLRAVLSSGAVRIRCESVLDSAGWPLECSWLLRVPARRIPSLANELAREREVRLCAELHDRANLAVTAVHRTRAAAAAFEARLLELEPSAELVEVLTHLRTRKRMGRELDARGHALAARAPE